MSDYTDINLEEMRQLLGQSNVSIVYLWAHADYWVRQQEFCDQLRQTQLTDNVVIHVQYEALSLTHSGVVDAVEYIVRDTGRDPSTVYIFSPNSIAEDAPWTNLFWKKFKISDEFTRSKAYWCNSPELDADFKTWALFVGRKTTPRLLALYDIWQDTALRSQCLLSLLNQVTPELVQVFDLPHNKYDQLARWLPSLTLHDNFREFCFNLPVSSADGYSVDDQYCVNTNSTDNRNFQLPRSLINLGKKYLFEITFETMTLGTTFTPSEKTVRTILAKKPLVVYAPKNFLSNLRALGFKTFGDLWDESYDVLEGPLRYQAIMKIVRDVTRMSQAQQLALHQTGQLICQHNYQTLQKLIFQKTK